MKDEAKIKSKHKRKFLLKFLLQQKLDQTNWTMVEVTSHLLKTLEMVRVSAKMGCGWQAD